MRRRRDWGEIKSRCYQKRAGLEERELDNRKTGGRSEKFAGVPEHRGGRLEQWQNERKMNKEERELCICGKVHSLRVEGKVEAGEKYERGLSKLTLKGTKGW